MPDLNKTREVRYAPGMEAGASYDLSLADVRRFAVVAPPESLRSIPIADGQRIKYFCTVIDSLESLYEQLSISIDVSTRNVYGSGSLSMSQDQYKIFNSHQTFIVARVEVKNAFVQYDGQVALLDSAAVEMLEARRYKAFKNAYGDGYFRGMLTGGCYYAVISLLSKSLLEQKDLSVKLQARLAGGTASVDASIDSFVSQYSSSTEVRILTYQDAGQGPQAAVIEPTFAALGQRMRDFTTIALEHPVPLFMHIAPYITLKNCPDTISLQDIEHQSKMLAQYRKIEFDYTTILNDLAFVQVNRDYFEDAPSMETLNSWAKHVSDKLNELYEVSRACSDSAAACPVFNFTLPADYRAVVRNSDGLSQEESLLLGKTWRFTSDKNDKTHLILTRNAWTSSFTGTQFFVDQPDKPPVVGIRATIKLNGCSGTGPTGEIINWPTKLISITVEFPEVAIFDEKPYKGFAQSYQGYFVTGSTSEAFGDWIPNFYIKFDVHADHNMDVALRARWRAHISQTAPQPLLMIEALQPSISSEVSSLTASCSVSSSSSSLPNVLPPARQRISLSMFRNIFASQEQKEHVMEKLFVRYGLGTKEKVLRQAILHHDMVVVSELLDLKGMDINEKDATTGKTALHEACIIGNHEIVDLLLAKGADKTLIDKEGKTPEHYSSELSQSNSIAPS